jgi:hypothetical protein
MDPPFRGLLMSTIRAGLRLSAAAGVAYALLLAVLTAAIRALSGDGVVRWPIALFAALGVLVACGFLYHLVRIGIGRWRLRPSCIWNEGIWWLTIERRKPGVVGVRITVRDDLGSATTHSFAQPYR